MKLLPVEEARSRMLAATRPLPAEAVPLTQAVGRVLAADVLASRDQPPFPASAMDGWAIRTADGAGPRRIVGESAAGHGYERPLGPGEAVRIFTGAPVPVGADKVVIQEEARREGDQVVFERIDEGDNIRPAALDFSAGDRLLSAGMRLDPWRLTLAAAAGLPAVTVASQPRVALLSTGEEVVPPGTTPGPFQIFNSGTTSLGALAAAWGAAVTPLGIAGDDDAAIAAAVSGAGGDLVVTLGGASVGDYDRVKPALERLGLRLAVQSVAMRPGKPTWFGTLEDGRLVLGLPGNPASSMVCAELFLRPLLRALQGAAPEARVARARLTAPLPANGAREHWMRVRLSEDEVGGRTAAALSDQDSSLMTVFAEADALLRRPIGAPAAAAGEVVEVLPLDRMA
ncbi:MAG TPA: gephyrin-like molybdotransferase Glp [Caulobacteraceae bacterium]